MADKYVPRMKGIYDERIAKAMTEKFGYKNVMEVPRISKIVLNMGVGEATQDKKKVEQAASEMELIAGQKPVVTKAKKSIAQFKLREGMAIGCKVTLRRERMYEFLDRFITIALPRVRDFRGLNDKSFDGQGARNGRDRPPHRQDRRRSSRASPSVRFPVPDRGTEAGGVTICRHPGDPGLDPGRGLRRQEIPAFAGMTKLEEESLSPWRN